MLGRAALAEEQLCLDGAGGASAVCLPLFLKRCQRGAHRGEEQTGIVSSQAQRRHRSRAPPESSARAPQPVLAELRYSQ